MSLAHLMKLLRTKSHGTKPWDSKADSARPYRSNPPVWKLEHNRRLAERVEQLLKG
jgi:hypothetical protein